MHARHYPRRPTVLPSSMQLERSSTVLPVPPLRAPASRDWGALVASILCVVFATVGALPFLAAGIVRSTWAETWAVRATEKLLKDHGVTASYGVGVRLWPVALELRNLKVASTDGGGPAITSPRAAVRPRFFALLSGKLAIDQIEIDAPSIRIDVEQGKLKNLDFKAPDQRATPGGPIRAPFSVFTVADAQIDLTVDGIHGTAKEIDIDVTADDDPEEGSSFEVAVRAGESWVTRRRPTLGERTEDTPVLSVDDDALCSIDGRFRIEPHALLIRRLTAAGAADLDAAPNTLPGCHLPADDKRIVKLAVNHLQVEWPRTPSDSWQIAGHVKARAPVEIAQRFVPFPDTDGWVGVDVDVRYAHDTTIPDVSGHLEARDFKLLRYHFMQSFDGEVSIRENVVTFPHAKLGIADGFASFTDLTVEPLVKGVPMKLKLDVAGSSFTTLMKNLGVSDHAHVSWDLRELHAPLISGTILPLHLDGDFVAQTGNFLVFDKAADDPGRQRIIGIKEAGIRAHVAIRPAALEFASIHLTLPTSTLDGGFCSIGFHNDIRVDVPQAKIDLVDIAPLASIPLAGQMDLVAHMAGPFNAPVLEADSSIQNFVFSDMPFGNVTAGHTSLHGLVVTLRDVKASKGRSTYEMPSARLDFGTGAPLLMDAKVSSQNLGVRDFFGVFRMDDDPRFTEIDGTLQTQATLHLALGGPEDVCGAGFLDVRATTHADGLKLYGETFDDGDADLSYRWTDRLAGLDGADLDLRALTLHKVHPHGKGPVLGVVLGSGTLRRGGAINMSLVLQSLPLSRVDALGALTRQAEGTVSGLLLMGGTLESYTAQGDLDVSQTRFRGATFGPSALHIGFAQAATAAKPIGKTHCGATIYPAFDKASYLAGVGSRTDYSVDGDLFGGQVHLDHVTVAHEKTSLVKGKIGLRGLQLGPVLEAARGTPEDENATAPARVEGELSGDITIDKLDADDLSHAVVRVSPTKLVASRGGQTLALQTTGATIAVADDALSFPPLVFQMSSPNGLSGSCTVNGSVSSLFREPVVSLSAELAPIDLGVLVGIVPKLERSAGTIKGSLAIKGKLAALDVDGKLQVRGAELGVHGWPSDLTDMNLDVLVDSNEARIANGAAKFAGGTVKVTGSAPIKGSSLGAASASIVARGIHLSPAAGITATLDANLEVAESSQASGAEALPHVTGDVMVTSFEYTRPINLEASAFGGVAKRTNVEVYDPSLDALRLDILVRSRSPLRIKNNLIEIALGIDSDAVLVTGTDQRFGLRGELKAMPGGRFHLRANDFDVRQGIIRFEDPTRIAPSVDVTAVTEYRRYSDTTAGSAAAAGTGAGGLWRISLHAYGDADHLHLDMTSDPPLSQEDIVLLLTIGMTRAEVDQLQAGSLGASAALEALATVSGADRAVKAAFPVIDDFRFGSAYSPQTGRTEPQVIVGKHLTDNVRATVATSVGEDEELRANVEWRLNKRLGVQASYDNINDVSSSVIGNVGVDLRWHLEFQ
jgi:translocation and assembly module TamB